ncbi:MAG TPA: amylo-alpha-1,6-glucosidase [Burkholderiales bacterium]|nr:amylo-alpha-1,6-glucosidase [Burkholderiales bacterium]
MRREVDAEAAASGPVLIPGVVSLAASSRRTLKHGDTFAMFDEFGDVVELPRSPSGLFHHDTRFLSRLVLSIDGRHRPLILSSTVQNDNVTLDVDLTNPDLYEGDEVVLQKDTFHILRTKFLWNAGCHELLTISSYAHRRTRLRLALDFAADFADLFEIRGYPRGGRGNVRFEARGGSEVAFVYEALDGVPRTTRLCFSPAPARLTQSRAEFEFLLGARERRALAVTVHCQEGAPRDALPKAETRFFPALRKARRTLALARESAAAVETSHSAYNAVISRSLADLAMLTTETAHGPYPYAGVPWFSAAFGRDGLITALEMLWLQPEIARGVLRFLAAHQGTAEDPAADMEPGKVLHEVRECELARLGEVPFGRYYGSVDATPLFVALAGLYWQRTRDKETLQAIWPNVKAALDWITRFGDRDGDGFVEYGRKRDTGLRNQGWKDSEDSVMHADGRLAAPSIALCEVQGYVYLAQRVAACVAEDLGDPALAAELNLKAQQIQRRFESAFWCEDLGTYALALDGDKEPCKVRSSNAGQLLFTGIVNPERAARVAQGLMAREFFTGWGIRTLSSREKRFNPTSYHNGSVWPHDNALTGIGFSRYGHCNPALGLTTALFDAAAHMHLRRLPELFCGFERKRDKAPTLYPVACAPQAWAACAPIAMLQACLGMEVDAKQRKVILRRPRLPGALDWLSVKRLQVGDAYLDLLFRRQDQSVAVSLLSRDGQAEVEVLL